MNEGKYKTSYKYTHWDFGDDYKEEVIIYNGDKEVDRLNINGLVESWLGEFSEQMEA